MKVAPLLAQYLYSNKRLDLPGLGTFILDPASYVEAESTKQGKMTNLEGVTFENNTSIKETPDLVQFIAGQTGKIKALAAADLGSHLGLALQFLNIGKPFLFEGIGTLTKTKPGEFSFTAGLAIPTSIKEQPVRDKSSTLAADESLSDYKSVLYNRKKNITWKKPVAVLLLLTGLGLAIWGGYTVYKKTIAKNEKATEVEKKNDEVALVTDTTIHTKDTITNMPSSIVPAGNYKFVLEISDATRAFSRFSRLKNFQWPVQMETKDSISFTLFMLLPANAADTSRLLDSLNRLNGKKVYIEP